MYQLVYVSSAVVPFSKTDLLDLLSKSRENNSKVGLTGLLLYKDGNIMQLLEGEREVVRATHARIERDPRHRGLITLLQGSLPGRRFPEWSMGFRDLRSPEVEDVPGFSPFLDRSLDSRELLRDPSQCERLLLMFKDRM